MERVLAQTAAKAERFEGLYRAHGGEALRVAYLLTGDRALAEELAQEAFVRLLGRFTDLRSEQAFRSYLLRTVVNLSRSYFRRRALERRHSATISATVEPAPDLETRDELWRALDDLPPRQRAALVLRYCEDLSEQQTAEFLETTPKAVKSLVTRGLNALRQRQEVSQ